MTSQSAITTSFGYDAAGNQTLYTDGNGSQWWNTYNRWGLQESRVEPSTAHVHAPRRTRRSPLAYNARRQPGHADRAGRGHGHQHLQQRRRADRPVRLRRRRGHAHPDVRLRPGGRPDVSVDVSNTAGTGSNATSEAFTYNDRGQVLTASGSAGSTSYAYNGDGLVTSVATPPARPSYTYDERGPPGDAGRPGHRDHRDLLLQRRLAGDRDLLRVGQRTRQSFGYDSLHRLTSDTLKTSSGATVASIGYGYDADSEITSETTTGPGRGRVQHLHLRPGGPADLVEQRHHHHAYGYDGDGNLTQDGSKTLHLRRPRRAHQRRRRSSYAYTARGTPASESGPVGHRSR